MITCKKFLHYRRLPIYIYIYEPEYHLAFLVVSSISKQLDLLLWLYAKSLFRMPCQLHSNTMGAINQIFVRKWKTNLNKIFHERFILLKTNLHAWKYTYSFTLNAYFILKNPLKTWSPLCVCVCLICYACARGRVPQGKLHEAVHWPTAAGPQLSIPSPSLSIVLILRPFQEVCHWG